MPASPEPQSSGSSRVWNRVLGPEEKALFDKHPRARYLVGAEAYGIALDSRTMPDSVRAAVTGAIAGARLKKL